MTNRYENFEATEDLGLVEDDRTPNVREDDWLDDLIGRVVEIERAQDAARQQIALDRNVLADPVEGGNTS